MSELKDSNRPPKGQFLVYSSEDGRSKNIFDESESVPSLVVKNFFTTAADRKDYRANFSNLGAIIFQTTKQNGSLNLQSIFAEREWGGGATDKESLKVQPEGRK